MAGQRTVSRRLALVALVLLGAQAASPATPPKLIDLGALLTEPGLLSFAVSLNDRGQIVGMALDPKVEKRYSAVVWQPGPDGLEAIFLGSVDGPVNYELAIPDNWGGAQRAINRDGFIAGCKVTVDATTGRVQRAAILWSEGPPGTFVPSPLLGGARARALNGPRQIIGDWSYWASPDTPRASLPVPPGFDAWPDAYDINDAGQIVGLAYEAPSYVERAMLWEPNGQGGFVPTVLPSPAGSTFTVPSAISNSGTVVGYALGPGNHGAVRWEKKAGTWTWEALDPPDGCSGGSAYGINDAGQVVGTAFCDAHSAAVLWTPDGAGALEATVLPAEGEGFAGAFAQTLNNRGQVVGAAWKCAGPGTSCGWNALMWESDTTPPSIANAAASPSFLWPPNHKLVEVTIGYDATDDGGSVDCSLGPVTANETLAASDWVVLDDHHVRLMSQRAGRGSGRVYSVPITCVDPAGNAATKAVAVTVPHDRR